MSYASLEQADDMLAHDADWMALAEGDKSYHLLLAALWLNTTYDWPGCLSDDPETLTGYAAFPYTFPIVFGESLQEALLPLWPRDDGYGRALKDSQGRDITGVPLAVRHGQILAAQTSVGLPLFEQETAETQGLVRKRIKAGPVEIDKQWDSPGRGTFGQLIIPMVDAMMENIAPRRGVRAGRVPAVF